MTLFYVECWNGYSWGDAVYWRLRNEQGQELYFKNESIAEKYADELNDDAEGSIEKGIYSAEVKPIRVALIM